MAKTQGAKTVTIKFTPNDRGNPPGKLADAELHSAGGPIDGLKLVGEGEPANRRRSWPRSVGTKRRDRVGMGGATGW